MFIPSERSAEVQSNPRDIVVHRRGGGLQAGDSKLFFSEILLIVENVILNIL